MRRRIAGVLCAGLVAGSGLCLEAEAYPCFSVLPHGGQYAALDVASPAAAGGIRGQVVEATTGNPIGYVSIRLCKKGTTLPVKTAVTDTTGGFRLSGVLRGNYDLIVSGVGYKSLTKEVRVEASSQRIDVGKISLDVDDEMLNTVQIRGQRSQMKFEIDKKVFNVGADLSSAGESASEVLNNIPSVEVDNEGEISLRGNSSVTIWINGKESGLTADNRAQILEQLPAETIDRIEVVTNPSAKFSPEGTAGIINIILKEDRKPGYFGSVQVGGNTRGRANAGANINYSSSKLDLNGSIGYRHFERDGGDLSRRTYGDGSWLNSDSEDEGKGNHLFLRGGGTYHIDRHNEINLMAFGMFGKSTDGTTLHYDASDYTSLRTSQGDDEMKGGNVQIGYKHLFREDHYLDFSASYSSWGMDAASDFHQTYDYRDEEVAYPDEYQAQDNNVQSHNWTIQLDYSNKINDTYRFEAGYKTTLSREDSPIETLEGETEATAMPAFDLYNRFLYEQDVHALYATFSGKLGALGYQLGLRGEYSRVKTQSDETHDSGDGLNGIEVPGNPFTKDYFDVYPSVFLTYDLGKGNEVQVNYSRRISRPWGGQLNSFRNITDRTNIRTGNPELMPEYSNAFELNYIKSWEAGHTISTSLYYRNTSDVIQRVSYMVNEDGLNVMYNLPINIGKSQSAGLELVGKVKPLRWLDLTATGNLYYYKLDGFTYANDSYDAQEQFSWNARVIGNVSLPAGINLQVTGNYRSPRAVAQGERKANYSLDAGLKKSFFDRKLSLNLTVRDLLDSRRWKTETSGTDFTQYSESWHGGRTFGLTVSYNFGNMSGQKMRESMPGGAPDGGVPGVEGYGGEV
ncbi:MAG: outer membrane beta-barrel protein [Bacteroidaceae bacterium]|jgi:outer membrane receptor protein involved in Fe transport